MNLDEHSEKFILVRFNGTVNTIRILMPRVCTTDVFSGNHKTKSAVLFILLTQTKEAPKKGLSE